MSSIINYYSGSNSQLKQDISFLKVHKIFIDLKAIKKAFDKSLYKTWNLLVSYSDTSKNQPTILFELK